MCSCLLGTSTLRSFMTLQGERPGAADPSASKAALTASHAGNPVGSKPALSNRLHEPLLLCLLMEMQRQFRSVCVQPDGTQLL